MGRVDWGYRIALGATTTLCFALAWKHRELLREYSQLADRASTPNVGMSVPTFRAGLLAGDSMDVGRTTGAPQLVMVFDTNCPYCRATIPTWKELSSRAHSAGAGAVSISLDSAQATARYAKEHALTYPVAFFPESKLVALYRSRRIPVTMVLDSTGKALFAHLGPLTSPALIDSVTRALARE